MDQASDRKSPEKHQVDSESKRWLGADGADLVSGRQESPRGSALTSADLHGGSTPVSEQMTLPFSGGSAWFLALPFGYLGSLVLQIPVGGGLSLFTL